MAGEEAIETLTKIIHCGAISMTGKISACGMMRARILRSEKRD